MPCQGCHKELGGVLIIKVFLWKYNIDIADISGPLAKLLLKDFGHRAFFFVICSFRGA